MSSNLVVTLPGQRSDFASTGEDATHTMLLDKFGLRRYFPEKITPHDVLTKPANKLKTLHDVPWYVLNKIFMLDHNGRDDMFPEMLNTTDHDNCAPQNVDDCLSEVTMTLFQHDSSPDIHPLDVMILIFQCSSNCLRQILCEKMFMCKLAIPIALPQFKGEVPLILMWSLRGIIIDYCDVACSIVNSNARIVSCLRLGNISKSKSKLLNEILCNQSHNTFYHSDCKNGMANKILLKGLLEIAWYIPSPDNEKQHQLSKLIAFLNHRGDGLSHKINREFLKKISDIVLILVDSKTLGKPDVMAVLKEMASNGTEIILMILPSSSRKLQECLSDFKICTDKLKLANITYVTGFTNIRMRNSKELKEQTILQINQLLNKNKQAVPWERYKKVAETMNFRVDENNPKCANSKKMAFELVKNIVSGNSGKRSETLQLQSSPWQSWSKLDKEEHRLEKKPEDSTDKYISGLHIQKTKEREKQLQFIGNSSSFLIKFMDSFLKTHNVERQYYLKWIKLLLDDHSRKTIPVLEKMYTSTWEEFESEDNQDTQSESGCHLAQLRLEQEEKLKKLKTQITESSFGLEHIFREIGQAYEAFCNTKKEVTNVLADKIDKLPHAMAELLLSGQAVELMDGEVSHIPILWIKAVLKELGSLIGDKKLFVMSVLGIQSSGKSTLLNTMFGLQFAVDAGRCTQGIFAQLVPICKQDPQMKYDYVLVVDTEGLRAPELGRDNLKHDNEIATFVIGLGDVTLINIKGENLAEMEDVLQIVVHAILKMKLVNKSLQLQPSCIFIHQNVGAQDANQKMKSGQQKLIETLDRVTKAAGLQEDAPDLKHFKQIINFDIKKRIWYFSDLWKGDPPMAPVNPGYSEKIKAVKQSFLTEIMLQDRLHLTVPQLSQKIEDLWTGILGQNFVFCFRNIREMHTYCSLETVLADLSWHIKIKAMKCVNSKTSRILSCKQDTESLAEELAEECSQEMTEEYNHRKRELDNFFERSEEKELLEQWRVNTCLKLKDCFDSTLIKSKREIFREIKRRRVLVDQIENMEMYREDLKKCAQDLAEDLRKKGNVNEQQLQEEFLKMWDQWMMNIEDVDRDDISIAESVINLLLKHFQEDIAFLPSELEKDQMERIKKNFIVSMKNHLAQKSKSIQSKGILLAEEYLANVSVKIESDIKENGLNHFLQNGRQSFIKWVTQELKKFKAENVEIRSMERFNVFVLEFTFKLAYEINKMRNKSFCIYDVVDSKFFIGDTTVNKQIAKILQETYSHQEISSTEDLENSYTNQERNLKDFRFDMELHVNIIKKQDRAEKIDVDKCKGLVSDKIENLFKKIQSFFSDTEFQSYRDEYTESLLRYVEDLVRDNDNNVFKFTKTFRTNMAVHICQFAIPIFEKKHKLFMEYTDPKFVLKRDFKDTYNKMFKNTYYQRKDETAFCEILVEHLSKGIEKSLTNVISVDLAADVRNNVAEVKMKPTFLRAVLEQLLDKDSFDLFYEYLKNVDSCFQRWIASFVNDYLFSIDKTQGNDKTRYMKITSNGIKLILHQICSKIENIPRRYGNLDISLSAWINAFHVTLREMIPTEKEFLISLMEFYTNIDLNSFTELLNEKIMSLEGKLEEDFCKYDGRNLISKEGIKVYAIILEECQGCDERCPFCKAPCSRNNKDHAGIDHMAVEHYPRGCGGRKSRKTKKLATNSCNVSVASDDRFRTEKANFEWHSYRKYRDIFPDWKIDGDPSVNASPYWKWFLAKYATELAVKYDCEAPDIPEAWNSITKEQARESLKKI